MRPFHRTTRTIIEHRALALLMFVAAVAIAFAAASCSSSSMVSNQPASVSVSISDPPSCMAPNGQNGGFQNVFITVRSVQAHASATADDNSSGWVELAPLLNSTPMQIDLFSKPINCVLAQLGSTSLPAGSIQQIRLLLVSNTPAAGASTPSPNACGPNGFNCVVLADGSIHELNLSSQANTGLKIPPGQIVGGPIQVAPGQSVDINIDFNACASIVQDSSGEFRLKPTLTAGQVSPNNTGISGQIVDSVTKAPIAGKVLVALEQTDGTVDRILMEAAADANGNFAFCPLPTGMFDIVAVAVGPKNLPYNATAVLNVANGTKLGALPLIAETGATAPATIQGFVTATTGTAPASADVQMAALQVISLSGGTSRSLNIPLETIQATASTPEVDSTLIVPVDSPTSCPSGSPPNTNCAEYTLVVPASNPSFGIFSASGTAFSAPAAGDVILTVDAQAFKPMSSVSFCTPSELTTDTNSSSLPLKVTAAMTADASRLDFKSCM
jgi:uncharacterized protein DUF4382